jgi:hypothetical protein
MNARRALAVGLAALLLAAVGGGIWYSRTSLVQDRQAQLSQQQAVAARGLIGSEKEAFFQDERVRDVLARHGVTVTVQKAGSRSIANSYDPKLYDFGFPSGAPAAAQLKAAARAATVYTPFYTPIVFASWRPIAEILIANGIAQKQGDFYYVVDLPALLALAGKGTRWRDLKGSAAFATGKAVLPASTDVRPCTWRWPAMCSTASRWCRARPTWSACCPRWHRCSCARASRKARRPGPSRTTWPWAWARRRCWWPTSRSWSNSCCATRSAGTARW